MKNICVLVLLSLLVVVTFSCESEPNLNQETLSEEIAITTRADEKSDILKVAEEMPLFPGCNEASYSENKSCARDKMLGYIYSNIKYPKAARDKEVEGVVVIRFVVSSTGEITDSKIVRDIDEGLGAEAKRIVDAMPNWIPGKQNGIPVSVEYNIPVKFKLE